MTLIHHTNSLLSGKGKMFFLCLLTLCCLSAEAVIAPFSVNVKNFGAKGDGITDDTVAIQKALDSCFIDFFKKRKGQYSYPFDYPIQEVVFPEGVYKISNTLFMQTGAVLRGEGKVVLKQTDPAKDILYMEYGHRMMVENLVFDGGCKQIRQWTRNAESSHLSVRRCTFRNAAEVGIYSLGIRYPLPDGKFGTHTKTGPGPYEITKSGDGKLVFKERDPKKTVGNPNSTLIFIEDCSFFNCARAVHAGSDGTNIRNCTIETPATMEGGALRLSGNVSVQGIRGLIRRDAGRKQSLIETRRRCAIALNVSDCELKTEGDTGAPFILSSASPASWFASALILRNIRTQSSNCPENAVIFFTGDACPNMIAMDEITETGKGTISACAWEKCPNIQQLDQHLKKRVMLPYLGLDRSYGFSFGKLSGNIRSDFPEHMKRFCVPYPATLPEPVLPVFPGFSGKVFFAEQLGRGGDDTEKLKKIFEEASKSPDSTVVLPGRTIVLSDTIKLSGDMHIIGAGRTILYMKGYGKDLFHITPTGHHIMFTRITFRYGKSAIAVKGSADQPFGLYFDSCNFNMNLAPAILAKLPRKENNLTIYLKNGVAFVPEFYRGNAKLTVFDTSWFCVYAPGKLHEPMFHPKGKAHGLSTMTNLGNTLYLKNILGVPDVLMGYERANGPEIHSNYRWIDNYDKLFVKNVRFGSEGMGLTPVYNYGPNTQVYMEGGIAGFNGPRLKRTPILTTSAKADLRMFFVVVPLRPELRLNFFIKNPDGTITVLEKANMVMNYPLNEKKGDK